MKLLEANQFLRNTFSWSHRYHGRMCVVKKKLRFGIAADFPDPDCW